jgi:hypothetical protein
LNSGKFNFLTFFSDLFSRVHGGERVPPEELSAAVRSFYVETKQFPKKKFLRFFSHLISKRAFNQRTMRAMQGEGWICLTGVTRVKDLKRANRRRRAADERARIA